MWKLPDWYGSILVALLVATLMTLWSEDPTTSYLLGFFLNSNALVLLFAWIYSSSDETNYYANNDDGDYDENENNNNKLPFEIVDPTSAVTIDTSGKDHQIKENNDNDNNNNNNTGEASDIGMAIPTVPVSTLTEDSYNERSERFPVPTSGFIYMEDDDNNNNINNHSSLSSASYSSTYNPHDAIQPPLLPTMPLSRVSGGDHSNDYDVDDDIIGSDGFFCWGFSLYYVLFFLMVFMVSGMMFVQSCLETTPNYDDANNYFYFTTLYWDKTSWRQFLFLLTFGAYFAACCIAYCQSYQLQKFMTRVLGHDKRFRYFIISLSILGAIGSWVLASKGFADQQTWRGKRSTIFAPLDTNNATQDWSSMYMGDAWSLGDATILYPEDGSDNDKESSSHSFCRTHNEDHSTHASYDGIIPVNLTVAWGGDWACPNNPDIVCQTTVQARVPCLHWNRFRKSRLSAMMDDDNNNAGANANETSYSSMANNITLEDYLHFRYHDYGVDDDDDAYYNSNKNNFDEAPSYNYWNRPSELIVGTCDGSCVAQSQAVLSHVQEELTLSTHAVYTGVGLGLVFGLWPLYELWRHFHGIEKYHDDGVNNDHDSSYPNEGSKYPKWSIDGGDGGSGGGLLI